jgi:hypothetical protein
MPSLPDLPEFPGKGLVAQTSNRVRLVAAGAGLAALALGGVAVRRVVRRGGGDEAGASADPIAETPTAPPGIAETPTAPPGVEAEAEEPEVEVEAPPNPAAEPGNISGDAEPHHALNNPVGDPDPTEYPDPFEKRDDPRDPPDPDGEPFGEEPHPQTGSESTSEPPSSEDLEAGDRAARLKRDKLDE